MQSEQIVQSAFNKSKFMKKCPFCDDLLCFFDNKKYCECNNCDSQYVEYINYTHNTNYVQYKTEDYFIYSANKENFLKTKIFDLKSNNMIMSVESIIPIEKKSLSEVNEKIKKLIIYK